MCGYKFDDENSMVSLYCMVQTMKTNWELAEN